MRISVITAVIAIVLVFTMGSGAVPPQNGSLLFQNLRALGSSFSVDDPSVTGADPRGVGNVDGPKGLAAADLDGDGRNDLVSSNTDGTVAVLFGAMGGGFEPAVHLAAGSPAGLRDVIAANVKGDTRPEILAAHPFDGKLYIFTIAGGPGARTFLPAQVLVTWPGARSVVAGDFNGDGKADLVIGGSGGSGGSVREYRGNGTGGFAPQQALSSIDSGGFSGTSASPVYTMTTWRHAGESRDRVVVSYAWAGKVWFLSSPVIGQPLAVTSTLLLPTVTYDGNANPTPAESVYDLVMAYVSTESHASGEPDLITADLEGTVFIRKYTGGYPMTAQGRIGIPGGPRGVSAADLDADSWSDLVVATRYGNSIFVFKNNAGNLSLASQSAAGASPRDVVTADFDGNGLPDAAVINRDSQDITVHRIDPASATFLVSPLVYRIQGGASAVTIHDMDGNGRGELLYLNPATGEANIHQITSAGDLLPAARYSMGTRPQTLTTPDVNRDGRPDLESSSIGYGQTGGGIRYRLQLPDHTFGPLTDALPEALAGSPMLAQVEADFNGDGIADRASLYADGRVALFEGSAAGLTYRRTEPFAYQSRALAAIDLDQDNDMDLVGIGAYGDVAIVENNGQWFTGGPYLRTVLPRNPAAARAYKVSLSDMNADGDPELIVFAEKGITYWFGGPGLAFLLPDSDSIPQTRDVVSRDFDGDGITDEFAIRPTEVTVSFYKGAIGTDGKWWKKSFEPFPVPSTDKLAAGDIDGDGKPDLVGVGEYLWIVLSGSPAPSLVPTAVPSVLPEVSTVVINEVLASSTTYVAPGLTAPLDCVEIYNGSGLPTVMTGWKLRRLAGIGEHQKPDFLFPEVTLQPGGRTVVYCSERPDAWHAPYKLPDSGATLQLINATGVVVNEVTFDQQQPDVSYSRLTDASRAFVYNPLPGIGAPNYDDGTPDPVIAFKNVDLALLKSNVWLFRAKAWSPSGMFTLMIQWREITSAPSPRSGSIPLYDDGLNDDGAAFDGDFAGYWTTPLPPGTAIEFYITGTDLRNESTTQPGNQDFTTPGQPIKNYTLSIPTGPTGWEISEVVAQNQGGLRDEAGKSPDWAEIRYTGPGTVAVQDLFLSDTLFGFTDFALYDVSRQGSSASTGTSHVVFLDGKAQSSPDPRHAPFKVDGDGDTIYLLRRLPSGATQLVDWVKVPSIGANVAYARLGAGGEFVQTTPTPDGPNARATGQLFLVPGANGGTDCIFVFSGSGSVEASVDMQTWVTVLPFVASNGIEHVYREPQVWPRRYFRLR